MKKTNVLIVSFIAIIFIVLTVVLLACAVFVIREIRVEGTVQSDLIKENEIIESSGIKIGKSIVTINKTKVKESIEKENAYIEVVSISRKFPNKIVIKATVRTAIMALLSEDSSCAVVTDSSMKVLETVSYAEYQSSPATKVVGVRFALPESGVQSLKGSVLDFSGSARGRLLSAIALAAEDPSLDLSNASFLTFFKKIEIKEGENGTYSAWITTNTGVILVIDDSLSTTVYQQLFLCMYVYTSDNVDKDLTRGFISLDKNSSIVAYKWMESLE